MKSLNNIKKLLDKKGSLDNLFSNIIEHHNQGKDFECSCYCCGADPYGLIVRGDVIPALYTDKEKYYCFRCSEGAYYGIINECIKNEDKKKEILEDFKDFNRRNNE